MNYERPDGSWDMEREEADHQQAELEAAGQNARRLMRVSLSRRLKGQIVGAALACPHGSTGLTDGKPRCYGCGSLLDEARKQVLQPCVYPHGCLKCNGEVSIVDRSGKCSQGHEWHLKEDVMDKPSDVVEDISLSIEAQGYEPLKGLGVIISPRLFNLVQDYREYKVTALLTALSVAVGKRKDLVAPAGAPGGAMKVLRPGRSGKAFAFGLRWQGFQPARLRLIATWDGTEGIEAPTLMVSVVVASYNGVKSKSKKPLTGTTR